MRIAIVGAGVAGLAAAYELEQARQQGAELDYELYESAPRLGGVISSRVEEGTVLEHGPDSFLTEKPAAIELCRELGLGDQLLGSDDNQRRTFILVGRRLVPLPDGLMFLVPTRLLPTLTTPLFDPLTKLRMGLEYMAMGWLHRARPGGQDESVASLVRRHYGQVVVDRLADPLLSGIYGGDAEQLSAQSVLPAMVRLESEYGSLTRGMLAARRKQHAAAKHASHGQRRTLFTTLRGGLQQLVDALVERLDPARLHPNVKADLLSLDASGWRLRFTDHPTERFDAVILATPAWAAARLVREVHGPMSQELAAVPYSSSITVNLVYDESEIPPLPPGFGFLVPAVERRAMLACTFVHRKFPGRTAPGKAVLRCFAGGMRGESMMEESEETIVRHMREDLRGILGIACEPRAIEARRWPRSMAQYSVGHAARITRIRDYASALPRLHLIGNAYDGIGISDCIRLGRAAAAALAQSAVRAAADESVFPHRTEA